LTFYIYLCYIDIVKGLRRIHMAVQMEKLSLYDLRVRAGFRSQTALGRAAGLALITVWNAENHKSIKRSSALLIVQALQERGAPVQSIEDIDWIVSEER
jgi:hypothetical protein